ncbi:hypothetical protein Ais01nite_71840 [Asanoa ishikariensis]|uniref:Excalibur calcium-binding domain-containing protein n=1 Tax=Asanoa ishikariensis TaxID=137265 RepID=A0A1H3UPJ3_9ACTN|nr:hypothetical protein [Asanoa ishikariensis]GIF69149.1 hypothetical protein Ais01nite_71840 [Asanoa ishikariensis]SDZ64304.1 hypothetical protein SAMN05421684_7719 [Asanoa ishikariensis]
MSRWFTATADWVRGRSRRERIGLAAVPVVLVLALVGVLVAGGGGGAGQWLAGAPATTPADESADLGDAGSTPADSGPGPTGPTGAPPPLIHNFADQPAAKPQAAQPSPTGGVRIAEGTDGCDHAYGDRDVCVPWTFPADVTDKCGWLKDRGFESLQIPGKRDRHGLDRNGDGTACGAGD